MSNPEYIASFIAALESCEDDGVTCIKQAGRNPTYFLFKDRERIGVIHTKILENLWHSRTRGVLVSVFKGLQNIPAPVVEWATTMSWGKDMPAQVIAAKAACGMTDDEPTDAMREAARDRANQRPREGGVVASRRELSGC